MKLSDILTLRGLKRKIGRVIEFIGAAGVLQPDLVAAIPGLVDINALKIFALGVIIRKLGEAVAKLEGRK